jgi:hypothetical protein
VSGRLRRFLHLERPRAAREDDPSGPASSAADRFAAVQRPRTGADPARRTGAALDRFGPEPDPAIELVEVERGARPFTRCMRCGMDHGVFATECSGCGASLDTDAQRGFNEKLWAERREEAAREARAAAERRVLADRAAEEDARARRGAAEELARAVGDRERRRIEAEERRLGRFRGVDGSWSGGWSGGFGVPRDPRPLAVRLLSLVSHPTARLVVAIAAGAALLALLVAGLAGVRPALYAGLVLLALLVPGARGPRRWRRWF